MTIEKGTIKVVWITKNANRIYSKMFDDIKSAEKFGRTRKDYIMFRLLWNKNYKTFGWTILPYGKYKTYTGALNLYNKYKNKGTIVERILGM